MKGSTTSIKGVHYRIETGADGRHELVIWINDRIQGRTLFQMLRSRNVIRLPAHEGLDTGDRIPVIIHLTNGIKAALTGKVTYRRPPYTGVGLNRASVQRDDIWDVLEGWARGDSNQADLDQEVRPNGELRLKGTATDGAWDEKGHPNEAKAHEE
ncbi:MAG: hypothetical protein AAFX99_20220, partial [Myxococcota bacterium]